MNKQEIELSKKLFEILNGYSEDFSADEKEKILNKVNAISERETDIDELDNYWKSRDLEKVCNDLATQRIKPNTLTNDEVEKAVYLIADALNQEQMDRVDYLLAKYTEVIEHHYNKLDALTDMIFWSDDYDTADKLIEGLKTIHKR